MNVAYRNPRNQIFEDALSVMAGDVFCAKLHRPGGTSSAAALAVGICAREPPQIFSYLDNLGIPVLMLTAHLPYPPYWPLNHLHENGSPDR